MISIVEPFNKFNTPRVAQLSQRSNQFNLRTVRYTEGDIETLASQPDYFTFSFTLGDKYGDHGMICVIILKKQDNQSLFIDTWFMSCRVLKRTMENFVLNTIANFAREHGYTNLVGEYIGTAKNEMVKDHYKNLGFMAKENLWTLNVQTFENKKTYIKTK
jgi:FkbH-like protein